jgi:hypothetical protein
MHIAVRPENGESYMTILRAIKQNVNIEEIGAQVSSITESRGGDILIKLAKSDSRRPDLEDALGSKLLSVVSKIG